MEPFEDDKFVAALESLRPAPRPAFAAELDERAAAGFPRRSRLGAQVDRLTGRLRTIQLRRALIPAGATALAAIAAVTVVIALSEDDGGRPSQGNLLSLTNEAVVPSIPAQQQKGGVEIERSSAAAANAEAAPSDTGPYASQSPQREIERSAELVLGTDPPAVRKTASQVFETVHAYRGIILNSSIRDGAEGDAGARFELLIPSAKLGDAMADFSAIGEVRSRREATADITAPTVRTGELLRDSQAKIDGMLAQLSRADTDAERAATEAKLRAERRHAAYLRAQLSNLQRRANFSRVALRIETGAGASSPNETGDWSIGDALDDAGHILTIAAGVTIVGLAIVGPLALLALLAWLANRGRIRRSRRRALA
jgi:Domain of unknown function (DUF4349)